MCGFAGFKIIQNRENNKEILRSMTDTIIHRGPDSEGLYTDEGVALGFRRLSIIDLEGGSQPMFNEDLSIALVFNGEIYNHKELREELKKLGHQFSTNSDSEVLIHGYEQYGEKICDKLIGMYSFVVWDKKKDKLFGARDIFGIKPFYYYNTPDCFLFASEIKAFLPHPDFIKALNEEHLPTYLSFEYIPTDETFFKNVFRLPGGHCFTYDKHGLKISQYYQIKYNIDNSKSLEEWGRIIDDMISDSVERHRISDVEVGCFLSSGVDSSIVAHKVSERFEKINGIESPVKTFSIGYDDKNISELDDVKVFAESMKLPNIAITMNDDMFFENASAIQYFMDEPLPNPSEIPLFYLTKKAAEYVKVVLSGEGADELFGGYPLYLAQHQMLKYEKLPLGLRKFFAVICKRLPNFKGKNFILNGALEPYERYLRNNYVFDTKSRSEILIKHYNAPKPEELSKPVFDKVKDLDCVSQTQFADIHIWMAFDILQKADKMSMAHSLELRVPFLDKKILEMAMQIPAKHRTDGKQSKICLRYAAKDYLPKRTVDMKKKGFPVPLDRMLREEKYYSLIKEKFQGDDAKKFFNEDKIMKLLNDHKDGAHNMKKIWTVYSFILWYEEFFIKR